jgi:DNA polymerase elongation subunit (family B)
LPIPKIAFLDIETAPALGYYFDLWKEGNIVSVKSDWYMLSFCVKWLGSKRSKTHCLCDYPRYKRDMEDDKDLVKELWKVFEQADIIIAHNGDRFDIRKANARFIAHGLKSPRPYLTVDTLKIARRFFKFDSNRLDSLGAYLKVGRKLPHTGAHLWLRCMGGDLKAWRIMRRYNAQDVELLERVYTKLRGWAKNHPNLNLITERGACPTCQSYNVRPNGWKMLRTKKYQQFRCNDCGAWHHKDYPKK